MSEPETAPPEWHRAKCCDEGRKFLRVAYPSSLHYDEMSREQVMEYVEDNPPQWGIVAKSVSDPKADPDDPFDRQGWSQFVAVEACPWCRSVVPEMKRNRRVKKVMVCTDGGYYCDTCEERLNCCECRPLTHMWTVDD